MGTGTAAKRTPLAKRAKRLLKRFLAVDYSTDGSFHVYVKLPLRFDARLLYDLLAAGRPVRPGKIVFDNYMGKGYGGNPKYITEKLLEKYPGRFEIVWAVARSNLPDAQLPPGVRGVPYRSLRSCREYATAQVWVSNYHKISLLKKGLHKRPGQYFVQTWHGSLGIKKLERDVPALMQDRNWARLAALSSKMVDYWISNSRFETQVYQSAFWDVHNVLEYGHPRCDLFFAPEKMVAARDKVCRRYGLAGRKLLLYAPTFRKGGRPDPYRLDPVPLQAALQKRFGGAWAVLLRLHPRVRGCAAKVLPAGVPDVADATFYPDIQELLAAADAMITDYSSCVFDFLLTRRPAFLYAPDRGDYQAERGFYYPLSQMPFPLAETEAGLAANIAAFDAAAYRARTEAFLQEKGCAEDGHAAERVADLIARLAGQP